MSRNGHNVLIVDDDKEICELLSALMRRNGLEAGLAHDGAKALEMIRAEAPDVVLLDYMMPVMDGMAALRRAREWKADLPIIMVTGYADVEGAVEAMKAGAFDYIPKPFNHADLMRVIHRALAKGLEPAVGRREIGSEVSDSLREKMGPSEAVTRIISDVMRVAKSDFSVVIMGETGSGKELVARAIHESSARPDGPFVPLDCGAIQESLLESELFGHEKGAFTSAIRQKPGKFEVAQGGTLFLDEVSNMPLGSQAKLLRALQDKTFYRVGGTKPLKANVRLVAATNRDLGEAVGSGAFRRDLFFRLSEFRIPVTPLRERKDDISHLAKRFLRSTNRELNKSVAGLSEAAMEALCGFHWPGNVRQLRSTIRRAVLLADEMIAPEHLDIREAEIPQSTAPFRVSWESWAQLSLKEIVRQSTCVVEREVLSETLRKTGGNKAEAARMLQIDYKTIHVKVKKYGIETDIGRSTA